MFDSCEFIYTISYFACIGWLINFVEKLEFISVLVPTKYKEARS
jgi:hypothetical protein